MNHRARLAHRSNALVLGYALAWSSSLTACGTSSSSTGDDAPKCQEPGTLGQWTPIPYEQSGTGRSPGSTVAWSGDQLLVWGAGYCSGGCGVSSYSPATQSWSVSKEPGDPEWDSEARSFSKNIRHSAGSAWGDDKWFIFGGSADRSKNGLTYIAYLTGLLIYQPGVGWREVHAEGEPAAREGHTMAWTGREVLVWGGALGSTEEYVSENDTYKQSANDGALFDPATETWRPMSLVGAPEGGSRVWTGERLLVWGKSRDKQTIGAQYDPETDEWSPIDLEGAPEARNPDLLVWGGGEAYVIGGYSSEGQYQDSIWAYRPATDTWRRVNDEGQPLTQGSMVVWTNDRLVVWGACPVGGVYEPTTDSWQATSANHVPYPRQRAFTFDTQYGALFFGGWGHHSSIKDGGILSF